jgi:hypothetical protein
VYFQVGPSYGRKMMTGYLKAKGLGVSEVRVGQSLRAVHEPYHKARQQVCIFLLQLVSCQSYEHIINASLGSVASSMRG